MGDELPYLCEKKFVSSWMRHVLGFDEGVEFFGGDAAPFEGGFAEGGAGSVSSPRPQGGPEASQRMSLAIFINEAARVFKAPDAKTISSCAERAANLLGCERKGRPVSSAILRAARSANSGWALRPVPTAVPPKGRTERPARETATPPPSPPSRFPEPAKSPARRRGAAPRPTGRPRFTVRPASF